MLVVTTPTGQVGSKVLARLVAAGEPVRVVARDRGRIAPEVVDKVEVVEGTHKDPATLRRALDGAEGLFWAVPPDFTAPDVRELYLGFTRPLAEVLPGSSVRRVVMLSTGGRGWPGNAGAIGAAHEAEELIESTGVAFRSLACGSFMDNMFQQIETLRHQGMFVYPTGGDVAMPVCATEDIAATGARYLLDRSWAGQAGVGVSGPRDLALNQMAEILSRVLGRPIRYQQVPGSAYKATLMGFGASEGMAQGLVDMFAAIDAGLYAHNPRTPESTTPTTFESWAEANLKPLLA